MSTLVYNELKRLGMNDDAALELAFKDTYRKVTDDALVLFYFQQRIIQLKIGVKHSIRTYSEHSEYVQNRMVELERWLQDIYVDENQNREPASSREADVCTARFFAPE